MIVIGTNYYFIKDEKHLGKRSGDILEQGDNGEDVIKCSFTFRNIDDYKWMKDKCENFTPFDSDECEYKDEYGRKFDCFDMLKIIKECKEIRELRRDFC